jgi:hypothetical protein
MLIRIFVSNGMALGIPNTNANANASTLAPRALLLVMYTSSRRPPR